MRFKHSNPFDYFDEIYYINLERRTDRKELLEKELANIGITCATRMIGVEDENPSRGCHLSHACILDHAIESGHDRILILEDDMEFFPDALENMRYSMSELPPDWDMFYLGANLDVYKAYEISPHIARLTGAFATHAYAIRRPLFEILYDINNDTNTEHNDVTYANRIHPRYNCYLASPLISGQRDSYSDIQKEIMSSNSVFQTRLQTNLVRMNDASNIYNPNYGKTNPT